MHVKTFVYGGAEEDFKDGLAKKIVGCYRSIEEECSINDRGIKKKHYDCVVMQAAFEAPVPAYPTQAHRVRDKGHAGFPLDNFCAMEKSVLAMRTRAEVFVFAADEGGFAGCVKFGFMSTTYSDCEEVVEFRTPAMFSRLTLPWPAAGLL